MNPAARDGLFRMNYKSSSNLVRAWWYDARGAWKHVYKRGEVICFAFIPSHDGWCYFAITERPPLASGMRRAPGVL